jgi:hypothetical protein
LSGRFLGGGGGGSLVCNEEGKDISVADSLWIIIFGQYGLVGLGLLYKFQCNTFFILRGDPFI